MKPSSLLDVLIALSAASAAAACGGERVALGRSSVEPQRWSEPRLIVELMSDEVDDNPTLTSDLLEIYFTSRRPGGQGSTDIWFAQRGSPSEPFGEPAPVTEVNTAEFEASPAVSSDGLTLWFGSAREGGLGDIDIWASTRSERGAPWEAPRHVPSLSSPAADIPRPLGQGDTVMPLASRRNEEELYWTYLAERVGDVTEFTKPELIAELAEPETTLVDGALSADGLTLWVNRAPVDGDADLYQTTRPSLDAPFGELVPLTDINTPADERDPWVSPDGSQLYFTSDRDGTVQLYVADAL